MVKKVISEEVVTFELISNEKLRETKSNRFWYRDSSEDELTYSLRMGHSRGDI